MDADMFTASSNSRRLAANSETLDERAIACLVLPAPVVQKAAALADHDEQAAPRMVLLGIGLAMLGPVRASLGEDSHLHLWRAGAAVLRLVFLSTRGFTPGRNGSGTVPL